jgi:Flp pilus assembly protein TadG
MLGRDVDGGTVTHRIASDNRPDGQTLVEFALVLPIIILLIFAIIDLGRGVFAYNTLAESARQANRMAIVDQDETRVKAVAIDSAPTLGLAATDIDVCFKEGDSAERTCNNIDVCGSSSERELGCLAIVTSTTNFQLVTPVIGSMIPPIQMSSTSIGPIEYVCPLGSKVTCP